MKNKIYLCVFLSMVLISVTVGMLMFGGCEMFEINLTDDERNVLFFAGVPQERVNEGALLSSEKRMLEALRQARDYLNRRYGGEQFEFVSVDFSAPLRSPYVFNAKSGIEPGKKFAVRVVYEKDEGYRITDSYYCVLKEEEVFDIIKEAFASQEIRTETVLSMDGLYGAEYDPALSVADILKKGLTVSVSGWVYAEAPVDVQKVVPFIENELQKNGICGGFRLMVVEGTELGEQIAKGAKNKDNIANEVYVSLPELTGGEN